MVEEGSVDEDEVVSVVEVVEEVPDANGEEVVVEVVVVVNVEVVDINVEVMFVRYRK